MTTIAIDVHDRICQDLHQQIRSLIVENEKLRAALAEPVQKPVAIVGTQEDTWKGYGGQWAPPGPPIKMVHMLRELPEGMLLYTAPPQRKPLTEEEMQTIYREFMLYQDGLTPSGLQRVARAIERAHGIGGQP